MQWLNHSSPRIVAGLAGAIMVGIALLLTEDEEGKVQNRLVDFWVAIEEKAAFGQSRSVALIQEASRVVGAFLDRIFGENLFSARAIVISCHFSIASLACERITGHRGFFLLICALGLLPIFIQKKLALVMSGILLISYFILLAILALVYYFTIGVDADLPFLVAVSMIVLLLFGFGFDVFFIVAIRKLLRATVRNSQYALGTLAVTALLAIIAFAPMAVGGDFVAGNTPTLLGSLVAGSVSSMYTNLIGGIFALLVFVLIGLALLHRIIWPILSRPIYALYRHEVISNHKLLFGIGTTLLIYAVPGLSWLEKLK